MNSISGKSNKYFIPQELELLVNCWSNLNSHSENLFQRYCSHKLNYTRQNMKNNLQPKSVKSHSIKCRETQIFDEVHQSMALNEI